MALAPVAPPPADADLVKRSVNLAAPVVRGAEQWLRKAREVHRRPAVSWLIDAALADLPAEVDELRQLCARYPDALYAGRPQQLGLNLRVQSVARLENAQFELTTQRSRGVALWHCVSAAVAARLEAEGITLDVG